MHLILQKNGEITLVEITHNSGFLKFLASLKGVFNPCTSHITARK